MTSKVEGEDTEGIPHNIKIVTSEKNYEYM
jgi:hypothetical protein